jgi:hypothetical protein
MAYLKGEQQPEQFAALSDDAERDQVIGRKNQADATTRTQIFRRGLRSFRRPAASASASACDSAHSKAAGSARGRLQ